MVSKKSIYCTLLQLQLNFWKMLLLWFRILSCGIWKLFWRKQSVTKLENLLKSIGEQHFKKWEVIFKVCVKDCFFLSNNGFTFHFLYNQYLLNQKCVFRVCFLSFNAATRIYIDALLSQQISVFWNCIGLMILNKNEIHIQLSGIIGGLLRNKVPKKEIL